MLAAWRQREAQAGRTYACGRQSLGGFPFRFELSCSEASAHFATNDPKVAFTAQNFHVAAQVYDPTLLIVRSPNVARPVAQFAFVVVVPPSVAPSEFVPAVKATVTFSVTPGFGSAFTAFPNESCTSTTITNAVPTSVVAGGWVTIASLFGAPNVTLNVLVVISSDPMPTAASVNE